MMRARDLGAVTGGRTGEHNAITDVPGVRVGHTTVVDPPDIHTGVTAIVPDGTPLPAGLFVGNGHGKLIGATQLAELGVLESPIVLTATLSAFRAADALVTWLMARSEALSLNPVVGECNDGYLSDIRARPITEEHVLAALDGAVPGPVPEGCVGAGTGTGALGYKAGIGTSSRIVDLAGGQATLGVLVQANFGGTLDVGSCMLIAATNAPLDARQLTRLSRRLVFGMARVGANYSNGSGDYGIAFSTTTGELPPPDADLSPLFAATLDAVAEAVLNSLLAAKTTSGHQGRTLRAIPHEKLLRSREQEPDHFVGAGAQRYYAESAERLGGQFESITFEDAHQAFLPFLPPTPATAADIGAGTGRDAAALTARGYVTTAVEPVRELRDVAQRLHPDPAITWLDDSLPTLSRLAGSFDLILLSAVWMHLAETERPRTMTRLRELLAPAGRLFISLRHGTPPANRRMFDVSAEETIALAERSGLHLLNRAFDSTDRLGRAEVSWSSLAFTRAAAKTTTGHRGRG